MSSFKVDYLCAIEVSGDEASAFLQSQLSADIGALDPGDCTFACYCTPRGQVIALLLVCQLDDRIHILCSRELADAVLKRLRLYVMRAKARFDLLEDVIVLGHDAVSPDSAGLLFHPGDSGIAYSVVGQQEAPASAQWKTLELAAGIFWLQQDSTEQFIPQMLGYDELGAVSFSKGCYPGQEIVARTRYLGKVKRGVVKIRIEGELQLEVMSRVRIERSGSWSSARVMDSTIDESGGTLAIVQCTREPEPAVTAIEIEEQTYRCATM